MKYYLVIFLLVFNLVPRSYAGDHSGEVTGHWLTQKKDSIVEIYKKDDLLFGKVVWLKDPNDKNGTPQKDTKNPDIAKRNNLIINLVILNNFTEKNNKWSNGMIYDPDNGKTYKCTIKLKGPALHIRGYIGISLFGRTEIWTKATLPEPSQENDIDKLVKNPISPPPAGGD